MKKNFVLPIVILLSTLNAFGQTQGKPLVLTIQGEVAKTISLTQEEVIRMKQRTVAAKDRNGELRNFGGVLLYDLLDSAGVTLGPQLRGENLAKYVLIRAVDGYEVIFSLAEVDPEFTGQVVLLAVTADGETLPSGEGPFRIVVPSDKKHARWIREVSSIHIGFASK